MFRCERCGSRYSAMHAVAIENCPRCQIRDRTTAPLTFKPFELADRSHADAQSIPLASTAQPSAEDRPQAV